MKNTKLKKGGVFVRGLPTFLIFNFAFLICLQAAENFGEVTVEPHAMFTGNTFHGYSELRVALENQSHTKAHTVTLANPNNSYNNGNSISSLSRTVKLPPDAHEIVSLLQPPLPSRGDGQIRITVDGHREGEMRVPNANNHFNTGYSYGRNTFSPTVFVSRSLDLDAVGKVLNSGRGAFTAEMAIGASDASRRGGYQPNSWMPDTRLSGAANWLELDYASPQIINRISIYNSISSPSAGTVTLVGISGTSLLALPMAAGKNTSRGAGWMMEFSFPETSEPVKTLKLDFAATPPYNLAVDAVEIAGTNGAQWAAAARASSDNSASSKTYMPGADNVVASLRAESSAAEWSENWLAYTPFDAVVLNQTDVSLLTPGVSSALTDYLYAGGNIFIAGAGELPAAWHVIHKEFLPDGPLCDVGFGHAFATEHFQAMNESSVKKIRDVIHGTARYWQNLPADSGAANAVLPVVENLKIPTRGIVVVMLAFIILIGPVNLFYLTRRKRRTWMLWTIPAISLATTLLVFAYSLLREGITPDTRIAGITFLDQPAHRAATIGAEGFYCPLTPSGGLTFESATEATPLVATGGGAGSSREVDWTAAQHFTRGWISSRVPAHFHVRKSETRRERIELVNDHGKLEVINSLGAPIQSIWFADAALNIYEGHHIAAGQKGGLIPSSQKASEKSGPEGLLREVTFAGHGEDSTNTVGKNILPNTYIAVLEGNPFIENALGAASVPKRTKSSAVVFGIIDAPQAQ